MHNPQSSDSGTVEVACEDLDSDGTVPYLLDMIRVEEERADFLMQVVIPLGVSLVYELDHNVLLERILVSAMTLARADGGALYLRGDDQALRVVMFRRDSLGVALGGTSCDTLAFCAIHPSDLNEGEPERLPALRAAATGMVATEFEEDAVRVVGTSGPEAFDAGIGYRVSSALAVPLRNNASQVIGVIELCNARREDGHGPVPFEPSLQRSVEALSLLAAAALESHLRQEQLKDEVRQLRIEVDSVKKAKQVNAIVGSDYFKGLQSKARAFRAVASSRENPPEH